jgi:hypothetical protein
MVVHVFTRAGRAPAVPYGQGNWRATQRGLLAVEISMFRRASVIGAFAAAAGLCASAAHGQQFVNPGFETSNLDGWTVTPTFNGTTNVQDVVVIDIDGEGPLEASLAARFGVGNLTTISGHQAGIDLFQPLVLPANTIYRVSFDWAATRVSATSNSEGGVFTMLVNGRTYTSQSAGSTSSTLPKYGALAGEFSTTDAGSYDVGVRITRPFTVPGDLFQHVDNFTITPVVGGACCMPNGTCVLATGTRCGELGGAYSGDGTLCTGQCPQPGACCVPTGCTVVSETECLALAGTYSGNGTACATANCPPAAVSHLVVPRASEQINGGSTVAHLTATAARTVQVVVSSAQIPIEIGSLLTGMSWRIASSATLLPWPEIDANFGQFDIEIASAATTPATMSVLFANNIGSNATVVRSGPLTIPANSFAAGVPAPGVNAWGYNVDFTTPFVYPGGDLVITIRHSGHDAVTTRSFDSIATSNAGAGYGSLFRAIGQTNITSINGAALAMPVSYITFAPPGSGPCYANCDSSTVEPVLNVDDFTCFINEYASAQSLPHEQQVSHYSNCDGSTIAPALNVDDFTCFINRYAQGCP